MSGKRKSVKPSRAGHADFLIPLSRLEKAKKKMYMGSCNTKEKKAKQNTSNERHSY